MHEETFLAGAGLPAAVLLHIRRGGRVEMLHRLLAPDVSTLRVMPV
jgi:hypothetical protein